MRTLSLLSLSLLAACEASQSPLNPPPPPPIFPDAGEEAGPVDDAADAFIGDGGAGGAGDVGPDTDALDGAAAGDAGDTGDVAPDTDADVGPEPGDAGDGGDRDGDVGPPPPDGGPLFPAGPPDPERVVVLAGRDDLWIAWALGDRLLAAHFDLQGNRTEVRDLGTIAHPVEPLIGARTVRDAALVFVPGTDGLARAIDLRPGTAPIEMGIRLPIRATAVDGEIFAVGQAAEPLLGQQLAWQVFRERRFQAPILDPYATPPLVSVSAGLGRVVLATAAGPCMAINLADQPDRPWACGANPDAVLAGAGERLFLVGQEGNDVTLRRATPGAVVPPGVEAAGLRVVLAPNATATHLLPMFDQGNVVRVVRVAPAGLEEQVWVVETTRAQRLRPGPNFLTAALLNRAMYAVEWDPTENAVTLVPAEPFMAVDTPGYTRNRELCPDIPRSLPEDCAALDRDCDTDRDGALCCRPCRLGVADCHDDDADLAASFPEPLNVDRNFVVMEGGGVVLLAAKSADDNGAQPKVALYSHPPLDRGDGPLLVRAEWPGFDRVERAANHELRTVIVSRRGDAEPPQALWWFLGVDAEGQPLRSETPTPCQPVLAVRFDALGEKVRFFCPGGARDVVAGEAAATEVPYPGNAPDALWIVRGGFGEPDLLLAAVGVENELRLWRDGDAAIEAVERELPPELLALDPAQRVHPIYLPRGEEGTIARVEPVQDNERLQVLVPELGWVHAGGSASPLRARISPVAPYAVSAGRRFDTETLQNHFFVHDLRAGGDWWGRPIEVGGQPADAFRGLAVPEFAGHPAFVRLFGGMPPYRFHGFDLSCGTLETEMEME